MLVRKNNAVEQIILSHPIELCLCMLLCLSGTIGCRKASEPKRPHILEENDEKKMQSWAVHAQSLISELEHCEKTLEPYVWFCKEDLSWEEIQSRKTSDGFAASRIVPRVSGKLKNLIWDLWRVTGRPPFFDMSCTQITFLPSLHKHIDGYRQYVETNKYLDVETIQKRGLFFAAKLLRTRYWQSAVDYFSESLELKERLYGMDHRLCLWSNLNPEQEHEIHDAFGSWLQKHIRSMSWDDEANKFRSLSGEPMDGAILSDAYIRCACGIEIWKKYKDGI